MADDRVKPLSQRERAARAVYRLRPFRTAMSTSPFDAPMQVSHVFDFDSAPAFYLQDCYEIADAVLATVGVSRTPYLDALIDGSLCAATATPFPAADS